MKFYKIYQKLLREGFGSSQMISKEIKNLTARYEEIGVPACEIILESV